MPRFKTNLTTNQAAGFTEMVPIEDSSINPNLWTEVAGDANADSFEELDEGSLSFDDGTTAWRTPAGQGQRECRWRMTPMSTPLDPSVMIVRLRIQNNVANTQAILKVYEGDGTTLRATSGAMSITGGAWQTIAVDGALDLSSVVDWTNVWIELKGVPTGSDYMTLSGISVRENV